ncbi:MAG: transposase [Anaerolineae bacterium]|nr:transposase [Anaerolineae bacterium]
MRVHDCPDCGLTLDRDLNASLNILARGLASLRL